MATRRTKKTDAAPEPAGTEPSDDAIARRAYEIFESGEGGSAEENWNRARREITSEHTGNYGAKGAQPQD